MNERKLSGISVCVMYALLICACFTYVYLGFASDCGKQEFVLKLPIFVQLFVADAVGLDPVLEWLYQRTDYTTHYIVVIATSFYALYWIGWWIARIDEEEPATGEQAPAPASSQVRRMALEMQPVVPHPPMLEAPARMPELHEAVAEQDAP